MKRRGMSRLLSLLPPPIAAPGGGGGGGGGGAAGFDPATLPWTPYRFRRWWHADEATFMNGAVPAVAGVPGEPVSKVVSQGDTPTFDMNYYVGGAPTLRNDGPGNYLNMSGTTIMLTVFGDRVTPKDTGLTFFAKYAPNAGNGVGTDAWLFGEDYSPLNNGTGLVFDGSTLKLRVYGDAGSYFDSADLLGYVNGGGQTLGYTLAPDAGGTCTVKIFTDSATPISTGTVTATDSMSRSIEKGVQTIVASFFGAQDFSANVADILEFLNNGSGA